jgi:hypothetical protein
MVANSLQTGPNRTVNVISAIKEECCTAQSLPLRYLEMIAYGKAIRSDRPILARIPYDESKKQASMDLDQNIPDDESPDGQQEGHAEEDSEGDDS